MTPGVADKDLLDLLVRQGGGTGILEQPIIKQVELAREGVYIACKYFCKSEKLIY